MVIRNTWLGFAKPGKKLKIGDEFEFGEHKIRINNKLESGDVEFEFILKDIGIFDFLDIYGQVPLPKYIKSEGKLSFTNSSKNPISMPHEIYNNV